MANWKPVVGYEGYYEVSDDGMVRSVERMVNQADGKKKMFPEVYLKPAIDRLGYHRVLLSRHGSKKSLQVHRLVLESFVGQCLDGMQCSHNDSNPANNSVGNLRWDTQSGNFQDKVNNGTSIRGSKNPKSKLSEIDVMFIRYWLSLGKWTQKQIGEVFGVAQTTISGINSGDTWSWFDQEAA